PGPRESELQELSAKSAARGCEAASLDRGSSGTSLQNPLGQLAWNGRTEVVGDVLAVGHIGKWKRRIAKQREQVIERDCFVNLGQQERCRANAAEGSGGALTAFEAR